MNQLKLVVASMSVLGLVSFPVFADQTKHHKKHHHHKMMKHQHHTSHHHRQHNEMAQPVVHHDYKDMGSLPVQPAEPVCTISQAALTMDEMTQNIGRALPNQCNPGWFNRIQLSGGINIDVGKWGNRNANYMGENYQRLSLNDAYLNISAMVNDWAHAFASISYNTATINDSIDATPIRHIAEYDAAYSNNITSGSTSTLQLEQAFVTLGNFDMSPVFVQVGKQFQDFGRYQIHPITESMTQVMSKTLATSAKVGFINNGFNGSLFVFDDPLAKLGQNNKATNYGIALGYDQPGDQMGWDVGAAYLYNLIGVNDTAYSVNQFNTVNTITNPNGTNGYMRRTGGFSLYGDVNSGPFTLGASWVATHQRFNVNDLPKHGVADINPVTGAPIATASGAKPWAAGIQLGYDFDWNWWGKNPNIYVTYQTSREAAGLNLPKNRWGVGLGVDWVKNTNFGVEWDHDTAYSVRNGGTGNNSNLVSLRAGVKFS